MYDVARSVQACLRANTAVHIAWIVSEDVSDGTQAVALTPGGGQIGSLLDGALDDAINQALSTAGDSGGIVDITLGPAEALISGLPQGSVLAIAISPGTAIPEDIWESLALRQPVSFAFELDRRRFTDVNLLDDANDLTTSDDQLVCRYEPVPRVVIVGGGPIADPLQRGFELAGWRPMFVADANSASGVAPTLSPVDGFVVMGHDVESSGRALQAAIASNAGYIGSVGSIAMQELREEWLAYRGVAWSHRIHGPAGLPIGAADPGEIAISIVAEAIASSHLDNLSSD